MALFAHVTPVYTVGRFPLESGNLYFIQFTRALSKKLFAAIGYCCHVYGAVLHFLLQTGSRHLNCLDISVKEMRMLKLTAKHIFLEHNI